MTRILSADQVAPEQLAAFLQRSFKPAKAQFLMRHGTVWHRGDGNRMVMVEGERVVAYQAVMPTTVRTGGERHEALWLVDVMVDAEHRGRGLQRQLDQRLVERRLLLIGFPNELAARIHHKHGWGVRDDLRAMLLPLRPRKLRPVVRLGAERPRLASAAALALGPLAALLRVVLAQPAAGAQRLFELDWERLAAVDREHADSGVTATDRSPGYLRWRYGESPFRSRIRGYLVRRGGRDHVVVLLRLAGDSEQPSARLLDLFGAIDDRAAVRAALRTALADVAHQASQITALTGRPELRRRLRCLGFVFSSTARFCWLSVDDRLQRRLGGSCHWVLGDADNDEPDEYADAVSA